MISKAWYPNDTPTACNETKGMKYLHDLQVSTMHFIDRVAETQHPVDRLNFPEYMKFLMSTTKQFTC